MKELKSPIECLSAIILGILIIPLGMIYNLGKSIYHCLRLKPLYAIFFFIIYWCTVVYQLWNVAKYIFNKIAVAIDLLGNVTTGELIEDCITPEEATLYGHGDVTISAATGSLEYRAIKKPAALNPRGWWLTRNLSLVMGDRHCMDAYDKYKRDSGT